MYLWNQKSPSLTGYRPNQAANRVYAGWASPRAQGAGPGVSGLGDLTTDIANVSPGMLFAGIGLLAAGMFLFGGKVAPRMKARKVARIRKRRDTLTRQLTALGG